MSSNPERRQTRRLSSILKNAGGNSDSPTMTFSRRSKRISFSHVKNVKEFVADSDNQTIWGNSYEKTVNAAAGCSSSDQNITNCVTVADQRSEYEYNAAPTPNIELFAGIEDGSDANVDVEMTISSEAPQPNSLQYSTQFLNQTMFIDETTAVTSVTTCQSLEMSIVSSTNKRKTNDTVSMNEASVPLTKSVKIRKIHNRIPVLQKYSTIAQHVKMDNIDTNDDSASQQSVNLDVTRIYDANESINNDLSNDQISSWPESKITNKTTTCITDMTVDDQSMISTTSDIVKMNVNKTQLFGRDDISAGVDQTFSVRNPMQDNNLTKQKIVEVPDDSNVEDYDMENDLPAFQSKFGNVHQPILDNLTTLDLQTKYKCESHLQGFQSTFGNTEEIEDLTISMDTNFKAEVSDEHDITKHDVTASGLTKDKEPDELQRSPSYYQTELSVYKKNWCDNKENMSRNTLELPALNNILSSRKETLGTSEEMNVCSMARDVKIDATSPGKSSSPGLLQSPGKYMTNANKLSTTAYFDSSGTQDNQSLAITNISFGYSEPLSSTRVAPINNKTLNFTQNDGMDITFNYCPTARQSRGFRSAASSQNNTDELCNLDPDQLQKRIDMKKLFLDITNTVPQDMLSETKLDLISESSDEELTTNESHKDDTPTSELHAEKKELNVKIKEEVTSNYVKDTEFVAEKVIKEEDSDGESNAISATIKKQVSDDSRCRKCLNCRRSLDGNNSLFFKIENLEEPQLDFSVYNKFKGLVSFKDVIEAREKRKEVRELQKQLLVDQNVEAPDVQFLWENSKPIEERPKCTPSLVRCYPMRMSIEYLMDNKMRTMYTKWKYFDNFFYIGAIAIRHEKVPSIRIHIKFDSKGPKRSDELNIPLLFKKVFIEECPTYLKKISPRNYLKHKHALALLPLNLSTMLSDSNNIYNGLDEIDVLFETAIAKVNELEQLAVECEAFLKMENRQCFVEKSVFDIEKYLMQELTIKVDLIDDVGPRNVFFKPSCETTDEFKSLPIGLPFLRSFLVNPKLYLLPFLQS